MNEYDRDQLLVRAVRALETIARKNEFVLDIMKQQMVEREEMISARKAQYEEYQRQQELARQVADAIPDDLKDQSAEGTIAINPAELQMQFMYNMNEFLKRQLGNGGEETT